MPIGTVERLAFALQLYTGQRCSDAVTMTWSDVEDVAIFVTPLKTKRSKGVKPWTPIHPALQEARDAADRDGKTIARTAFAQPIIPNGFGSGFMAVKIDRAGLQKRCVTHGLRKAVARELAEAGCTANEIAAISGHATLQEVSRYTKAAEQKKDRTGGDALPVSRKVDHKISNWSEKIGRPDRETPNIQRAWRMDGGAEGHRTEHNHQSFQSLRSSTSLNVAQ